MAFFGGDSVKKPSLVSRIFGGTGDAVGSLAGGIVRPLVLPLILLILLVIALTIFLGRAERVAGSLGA